jgi:hypothetical protein
MKKTTKTNVLKGFNDTKVNAVKKANATMSTFKKSLPKAQFGIISPEERKYTFTRQGPLTEGQTAWLDSEGGFSGPKGRVVTKQLEKQKRKSEAFNKYDDKDLLEDYAPKYGNKFVNPLREDKMGGSVKRNKK